MYTHRYMHKSLKILSITTSEHVFFPGEGVEGIIKASYLWPCLAVVFIVLDCFMF